MLLTITYRRVPARCAASISFTAPPSSIVSLRADPLPGPAPAANTTASQPVIAAGIADQGDDSVAALRQDPGETQGDLAVAAGNGYTLASAYVRGWPASLQVVWFVLALIQSERRILVPHQGDIDQDPVEPAIDAHEQV